MNKHDITALRLYNQQISNHLYESPYDVVRHLCAMQAQDYPGALWSVALRTPAAHLADIERAIEDRQIVRSWPMRGTLHFVAAEDLKWMCQYLTPRVISGAAARHRNLELDEAVFNKSRAILEARLAGGNIATRSELCELLDSHGIKTAGQRGIHILWYWAQRGVLCYGPHRGKEPTFVLLDEWIKDSRVLEREQAFAELAERYFTSHGPATINDFAGWIKCSLGDARTGLKAVESKLVHETIEGVDYWFAQPSKHLPEADQLFLLSGFDEYMLGYKDRSAMLEFEHSNKIVPGNNGMFLPTIIWQGQVVGLWKRSTTTKQVRLQILPFKTLHSRATVAIYEPAERYATYLGLELKLDIMERL